MTAALPMAGLNVVDLSQGLAGPYCGMLLAHHGADVVKVEPPQGDWSRTLGVRRGDMTAAFLACNRGKRGVVLDLKNPREARALRALVVKADVLLESNRPGVTERLGFGFKTVLNHNPRIVYLSVTGYGQHGPYRDRPVTDAIMQAFSGFMTRNPDSEGVPRRVEFAVPDYTTGLMAYQAVSTALLGRERGQHAGRHLDVSLMGAMLAFQQANIIDWELGNRRVGTPVPPTGTYATKDGLINISVVREKYFEALCDALSLDDLVDDERFSSMAARRGQEAGLREILDPVFAAHTTAEMEELLSECDVPHCRVNRYDEAIRDEHVTASGALAWANQPAIAAEYPLFGVPGSERSPEEAAGAPAPSLGQHTAEVLAELALA